MEESKKDTYFILKDKKPIAVDITIWAKWYESSDRIVKKDDIDNEITVSTVFLSINHAFESKTPILFETMIFGGKHDGYCKRYSTWDDAEIGHNETLNLILK